MSNNFYSRIKSVLFLVVLVSTLASLAFAASGSSNAKKFYLDLLDKTKDRMLTIDTSTSLGAEIGKITIDTAESIKIDEKYIEERRQFYEELWDYYYKDEGTYASKEEYMESRMKYYSPDTLKDQDLSSNQTIIFDKLLGQYYSKKESTKDGEKSNTEYVYDAKKNLIYVKKEDGSIVYTKPTNYMLTDISSYVSSNSEVEMKLIGFIFDKLSTNLKDEYFKEEKVSGFNKYTISLNKEQMKELCVNVLTDLMNDKDFKTFAIEELGAPVDDYEDDMKSAIEAIKEEFDDAKEAQFELSVTLKGNDTKTLNAIKLFMKVDEVELDFELNGEPGKTLLKSKQGNFKMISKDGYSTNDVEGSILFGDNKISIEMSTIEENPYSSYKHSFSFVIQTKDNKKFLKSSNIEIKCTTISDSTYEGWLTGEPTRYYENDEFTLTLRTDDKKSFDKSKKIIVDVVAKDGYKNGSMDKVVEHENKGTMEIVGNNNKEILKSNKITMTLINEDSSIEGKIIINAEDNKEILKSSNVSISVVEDNTTTVLFNIKANDKKAIKDSTNLEIEDFENGYNGKPFVYKVVAHDKKKFTDSRDIEFSITNTIYEDESAGIRVTCLDKKDIHNTKKLKITGFVDGGNFEIEIESKDNKPLEESEDLKLIFKYESFDKKNTMDFTIDGKNLKGHIHSTSTNYNGSTTTTDMDVEMSELKESNISSLMDTSKATESNQKDVSEILGVYYFDYEDFLRQLEELSKLLEEYDYEYEEDYETPVESESNDLYNADIIIE